MERAGDDFLVSTIQSTCVVTRGAFRAVPQTALFIGNGKCLSLRSVTFRVRVSFVVFMANLQDKHELMSDVIRFKTRATGLYLGDIS